MHIDGGPVGRDAELADVDAFLTAVESEFTALALEGEPGIGKTTVWREVVRRAEARGSLALPCRPAAAEAKMSFAGIADLLGPVDDTTFERLPDPQRRALEIALLRTAPTEGAPDRRTVATALLSLLRNLAAERPVLVAVDDAHWLDPPSGAALAFAARRLATERAGVVCSYRPAATGVPVIDAVPGERRRSLVLGPLSLAALGRIIAAQLGESLPRPMLVRILEASGGNPFYALEVARLVIREGIAAAHAAALPVPDDLRALTRKRMRALPTATRAALLRAAMLSAPDTRIVEPGELAAAEEAGLISIDGRGRIEFSHPLFASAITGSATTARRQELHRRLAAELTDPEQRARHLALGSTGTDEGIARELDAAARLASSRGAPGAAAELAELALARTAESDAVGSARRLLDASRFRLDAGDLSGAHASLERALAADPPLAFRAELLQLLSRVHGRRSSFQRALELAVEALEGVEEGAPRASVELEVAYCSAALGNFAGAQPHAREAIRLADASNDHGLRAHALAALTVAEFLSGHGFDEDRIGRALALEDGDRPGHLLTNPRYIHGFLLLSTGRLAEARTVLEGLRAELVERGQEGDVPFLLMYLGWPAIWSGDLGAAAAYAEGSREAADLLDDPTASALALSLEALVHAHRGEIEQARGAAREAIALLGRLQWAPGLIWPLWALGFAELSVGNFAGVDGVLGPPASQIVALVEAGEVTLGLFLPDEIEALIALGDLERAEELLRPLADRGRELDRPWALAVAGRCRGVLLGAIGELDRASEALDRALIEHARVPMPFELARTLLVAGQVQRRRKRRGDAREALLEALNLFERVGTPLWAERARAELRRVGVRTGGGELTATERHVAELAASGLTNREIAERSFLSVKAVEGNLTRAYRKLEIHSRGGLARALDAAAAPAEAVKE